MGDRLALGEINKPFNARLEGGEILDVEPARVHGVPGEQNAGIAIIESNAHFAVARDRNNVDDASAQVNLTNFAWPIPDSEEFPGRLDLGRDERDGNVRIVERLHSVVSPGMVCVLVSVGDDQRNAGTAIALEPVVD